MLILITAMYRQHGTHLPNLSSTRDKHTLSPLDGLNIKLSWTLITFYYFGLDIFGLILFVLVVHARATKLGLFLG